jgi:hypothetical protein
MAVGTQLTSGNVNAQITNYSLQLRNLLTSISQLSMNVNGQGTGQATLVAAGYSSTDATTALAAISYLNTIAALYFGTATQATTFNFNNQLSVYWGGS